LTTRDTLIAAGQALYGERWQSELGAALGYTDKGRNVRRWINGDRPIPERIWPLLRDLMRTREGELADAKAQVGALCCRVAAGTPA